MTDSQERVAAIEERLAASYAPPGEDHGAEWSDGFDWAEAMRDIRTLINELTELRERNERLLDDLEETRGEVINQLESRKQMEEALRETRKFVDFDRLVDDQDEFRAAMEKGDQALTQGTETASDDQEGA